MNSLLSQYQAKRPWILRVSGCSRFSVRNPPYIHHVFWFTNHPPAIGVAQNPPVASNKSKSMFSILSRQGTSTSYHFISYHNRNIYVYIYIHLFTSVDICLHLFTSVSICFHLFPSVYICFHLFTSIYHVHPSIIKTDSDSPRLRSCCSSSSVMGPSPKSSGRRSRPRSFGLGWARIRRQWRTQV